MFKKRIVALVTGIALMIAVAGASTAVANSLENLFMPEGQAIACHDSGSSGGGC
jgi:hypothetical protein